MNCSTLRHANLILNYKRYFTVTIDITLNSEFRGLFLAYWNDLQRRRPIYWKEMGWWALHRTAHLKFSLSLCIFPDPEGSAQPAGGGGASPKGFLGQNLAKIGQKLKNAGP